VDATTKAGNARWWEEPKDAVDGCLVGVYRAVYDECAWCIDADEYHAGLYRASEQPGVRGESRRSYEYGPATLPYNVCRSAVDTLQAKIAKHRPLPQVLTQRGSWKNQKRARKMTQFLEGEFYRQRVFETTAPDILRDALIFGRGILKVWTEKGKILTERGHPWEYFVDPWDARYGEPRNLYHNRSVDRGMLIDRFARTESGGTRRSVVDAIEKAGRFTVGNDNSEIATSSTVDRVDVLEAWHLPSSPDAKDGRHVVVIQGATLLDERWEHDYFPIAVLSYNKALSGYWGHGLVEQLEGYAYEINLSSEKSSEQFRMSGVGILVPDGSGIHDQQIRNGISILRHKPGMPPQVFQMDLVNEHVRQRPRELTQDALNDAGLSQMSVQSEKPAGVTAAIALQTLDDIETERFMIFGRAYEAWCLDIARRFIDCAKDIAAEYGDMAVSVPMKGGLLDLNWNDVYVDGVEIRVFPTSLLPQQLPARLDRLKGLFDSQLIDRATFLRHLDAPDMQAELDLETADRLVIDEILEAMMEAEEDEGESAYIPPSAYQDIEWAGRRAQQKLNRATLDKTPEFNKDMLRRYLKDIDRMKAKMAPPPPPMPAMPPPGAPPMPPPPGGMPMPPPAMPAAA
jgi:hypothetical protein